MPQEVFPMASRIWPLASRIFLEGYFPHADHSTIFHATSEAFQKVDPYGQEILLSLARRNIDMNVDALVRDWLEKKWCTYAPDARDFISEKLETLKQRMTRILTEGN